MANKNSACGFPFHPLANIFPLMNDQELAELTADIDKNYQQEPVILCDGMILDGRNRALAMEALCERDGDDPRECLEYEDWTKIFAEPSSNILSWVASKNLHRRHLSSHKRKLIALEFEKLFAERAKERKALGGRSSAPGRTSEKVRADLPELSEERRARTQAAKVMGVSSRGVQQAKQIMGDRSGAVPELKEAVRNEEVSLDAAAAIAKEEPELQRQALTGGKKGVATAAKSRRLSDDELFEQSVKLARAEGHASAAMLQNKFVIGLGRAEKMIDRLQRENIIDPDSGEVVKQPTVIEHNFDPHDDLEEILDVYAGEIPDSQIPLYVDLLWAIAANPNVEAIQRVARRLSED